MRHAFISALLLLALVSAAAAQNSAGPGPASAANDGGWLAVGVGGGAPYGGAAAVTASLGRERIVQVGLHSNARWNLLGGRSEGVNAFHVGVGRSRVSRWDRTALALDPALVWGQKRSEGAWRRYATVGALVSAQAMFTPIPELGLGLDAFAHLNPVRSGLGVALTFVFEANK